jgi:hypothetical protein
MTLPSLPPSHTPPCRRRALLAYNDLFTDMQPWLESISQPGALDTWAAKQFGQQTGQQAM